MYNYAAVTISHARMTFNDWTVIFILKSEVETPILMSTIKNAYPHQMQNSMSHNNRTSMSSLQTLSNKLNALRTNQTMQLNHTDTLLSSQSQPSHTPTPSNIPPCISPILSHPARPSHGVESAPPQAKIAIGGNEWMNRKQITARSPRSHSPPASHSFARSDGRGASRTYENRLFSLPIDQTDTRERIESCRPFPCSRSRALDRTDKQRAKKKRRQLNKSLASKQAFAGSKDKQLSAVPVGLFCVEGVEE